MFHVLFDTSHPRLKALAAGQRPPLHFHPHQLEYIRVLKGRLGLELEMEGGKMEDIIMEGEEESATMVIRKWTNHRIFPVVLGEAENGVSDGSTSDIDKPTEGKNICEFLIWGEQTREAYKLDLVFFENWYSYQDEMVLRGGGIQAMSVVQVMSVSTHFLEGIDVDLLFHNSTHFCRAGW